MIPDDATRGAASVTELEAHDLAQRTWQRARELLLAKFGAEVYRLGVESLQFTGSYRGLIRLVAPDSVVASWMPSHYPGAIEEALRDAGMPCRVEIFPGGRNQGELFPEEHPPSRRRESPFSSLLARYTFATFVVGASNQFAHAACRAVAAKPGRHYNPLFVYGGVGLGKTHLANAIGHETLRLAPDARVAYLSAETFMNQLINALRRDRMEEFKGIFRKIDVLILDDVQFLANRERTQEEFFHTFNALHESHRQIVLTSDKVPKDIPGLEERLRNRFEWGLIADIQPPDVETRVAILERKAELDGLDLPHEVALYLASKIDSNVRELEGSLTRLSAFASLSKSQITVDFARHVLHDLMREHRVVSVETIQKVVCEFYGLRLSDLLSKRRSRHIAHPRQVAMYLTRKLTRESFPNIGERFGGRDHSTVIHATTTIERRIRQDERLRTEVERLERVAGDRGSAGDNP